MKISTVLKKYKPELSFTLFLLLIETGIAILFPLFIGYAIDDALSKSHQGVLQLGLLGIAALVVGVGRRLFDSRFYAKVYQSMGSDIIAEMKDSNSSVKSARLSMLGEFVEFLENSLPELLYNIIGLIGVSIIIAILDINIFYISILVILLIFLVYWMTTEKTIKLNESSNDELEKQVDILNQNNKNSLRLHLNKMMSWNIKLSDLEAGNFSISWFILMAFLTASIIIAVGDGIVKYGALFSLIMYVFQYIENVANLPLFYQNCLRLKEIQQRIEFTWWTNTSKEQGLLNEIAVHSDA